jgi:uncharacterized phage infection (PIP) family protein YhgE
MAGNCPPFINTVTAWNKSTYSNSTTGKGRKAMEHKDEQDQTGMSAENADGNVEQIREILFGGQMRDYERRFAALEERLTRNVEQISQNFENRLEQLDAFAKQELEKFSELLQQERAVREQGNEQGAKELRDMSQRAESQYAELQERLGGEANELRQRLQDNIEELSSVIHNTEKQLSEGFVAETKKVADTSVRRDDLAALLSDIANRLTKDQ